MDQGLIPQRYARALYKVALQRSCDNQLYDLLRTLAASFEHLPALNDSVANPYVPRNTKEKLILTAAGIQPDDNTSAAVTLSDFVKLLENNRRIDCLRSAALAYINIYRRQHHIARVTVTSASPLTEDASERLRNIIAAQTPGYTLEYSQAVDPDLIGGFTVAIDNSRLDASVKNELKQMRLKLLSK